MDNLILSQKPLHGTAGVNNSIGDHGYAYRPDINFVGSDHFQVMFDHHFSWSDTPEKAVVDVEINVTE